MAAEERLSVEAVGSRTLMAAQHVHRYRLAASLCSGLRVLDLGCGVGYGADILARGGAAEVEGVDIDAATIAAAQETFGSDTVRFRAADAVQALRALDPRDVDAIVSFEALEHLPELEPAIDRLAELSAAGVKMVLSVPNSRMFREENEFHLTDFGYDEAQAAFGRLAGVRVLYQHLAEGSLIAEGEPGLRGTVEGLDEADPEYAHAFIALAGFPADAVTEATARLALVAIPNLNRYMIEIERANAELWRTNQRLTRERLGHSDAAAAVTVERYEKTIEALQKGVAERDRRILVLEEVARRNDELYQQEVAWRDAKRYHAVDKVRDLLLAIPGMQLALRLSRSVLALRIRRDT